MNSPLTLRDAIEQKLITIPAAVEIMKEEGLDIRDIIEYFKNHIDEKVSPEFKERRILREQTREKILSKNTDFYTSLGIDVVHSKIHPDMINDLFPSLDISEEILEQLSRELANLQVTKGCSHGCTHCALSANRKVLSMPYHRIYQLLSAFEQHDVSRIRTSHTETPNLCNYYDSDVFDYYDPTFDTHYGDVLELILQKLPTQNVHITTRGWQLQNTIGQEAGEKVAALRKKYPGRIELRISIDLYTAEENFYDYVAKMQNVISTVGRDAPLFFNIKYDEHNKAATLEALNLLRVTAFPEDNFLGDSIITKIQQEGISDMGRATKLDTNQQYDVGDCMYGFHIHPDGKIKRKELRNDESTFIKHKYSATPHQLWNKDEAYNISDMFSKIEK